ncbi:MAG: hypothetical protein QM791_04285 [Ferruginibacter sp.]
MSNYLLRRRAIMMGTQAPDPPKEKKPIPKISEKKKQQLKEEKPERDEKEKWFKAIRKKLTGFCQCGCGQPSSKNDNVHFRSSCCHIFPKSEFKSVQFHESNYVERNFWDGCHSVMDNTSLDRWPNMEDWDDIKEKVAQLVPLLTPKEKASKFFTHLDYIIKNDSPVLLATHDNNLKATIIEQG